MKNRGRVMVLQPGMRPLPRQHWPSLATTTPRARFNLEFRYHPRRGKRGGLPPKQGYAGRGVGMRRRRRTRTRERHRGRPEHPEMRRGGGGPSSASTSGDLLLHLPWTCTPELLEKNSPQPPCARARNAQPPRPRACACLGRRVLALEPPSLRDHGSAGADACPPIVL
jgi:hypothetical protein